MSQIKSVSPRADRGEFGPTRQPQREEARLPFQPANTIFPAQQRWLLYPYLASNSLAVMAGDPGCGKSSVALALIAELSNGRVPEGMRKEGVNEPQRCLFVSVEDTGATIARRLIALGANQENIRVIAVDTEDELGREPTVILGPELIKMLAREIREFNASILVLDTVAGMIHASKDMNRQNVVRAEMKPLQRMASQCECAVLALAHFTKGGRARHASARVMGSLDFTAVARIVILMGSRAGDREHPAIVVDKSNLGPRGPQTSYGYHIQQQSDPYDPFVFTWTGPSTVTAEEMTSAAPPPPNTETISARCHAWLIHALEDAPRLRSEVIEEGVDRGFEVRAVRREWQRLRDPEDSDEEPNAFATQKSPPSENLQSKIKNQKSPGPQHSTLSPPSENLKSKIKNLKSLESKIKNQKSPGPLPPALSSQPSALSPPKYVSRTEPGYSRIYKTKGAPPKWWGRGDADWSTHWESLAESRQEEAAEHRRVRQATQGPCLGLSAFYPLPADRPKGFDLGIGIPVDEG